MATKTASQKAKAAQVISNFKASAWISTTPAKTTTPTVTRSSTWSSTQAWDANINVPSTTPSVPSTPVAVTPVKNNNVTITRTPWDANINVPTTTPSVPATPATSTSTWSNKTPAQQAAANQVIANMAAANWVKKSTPEKTTATGIEQVSWFNFGDTFASTPELQKAVDFASLYAKQEADYATQWKAQNDNINNMLSELNQDTANQIDTINQQRVTNATESFSAMNTAIADLLEKSKNLYDTTQTVKESNLAGQLADRGYINAGDAGQVASYQLADYRRNAELQKSTIEQQVAEKKISIEQAKQQALDAIAKDTLTSAQYKQNLSAEVIKAYGDTNNQLEEKLSSFRKFYADTVSASINAVAQGKLNVQQQTAAATAQAQTANNVENMLLAKALADRKSNPNRDNDRYNYVISKMPENLQPFASQLIPSIPNFYERTDFPNVISELMAKSTDLFKKYQK